MMINFTSKQKVYLYRVANPLRISADYVDYGKISKIDIILKFLILKPLDRAVGHRRGKSARRFFWA